MNTSQIHFKFLAPAAYIMVTSSRQEKAEKEEIMKMDWLRLFENDTVFFICYYFFHFSTFFVHRVAFRRTTYKTELM